MIKSVVCEALGAEEHDAEMEVAWPRDKKRCKNGRQSSGCGIHDECVFVLDIFTHSVSSSYLFFLISNLIFLSSDFLRLIFLKV